MTENFYSIIYVNPNHLTNERIAIGLIIVSNGVPYFNYSTTKLKWLSYDLVKSPVKNHLEEIESIIKNEQETKVYRLFNYRFSKDVFEDLTKKSRGLVSFDKPQELHQVLSEKVFDKLFLELIGAKPKKEVSKKSLPMRVKWTYWLRKQEHLKGTYKFSPEGLEWATVDYAFVSKNKIKVFHCIDPETSKKLFKQSMSKLDLIIGVLEQHYNKVELFLVHGNELSDAAEKLKKSVSKQWISLQEAQKEIV